MSRAIPKAARFALRPRRAAFVQPGADDNSLDYVDIEHPSDRYCGDVNTVLLSYSVEGREQALEVRPAASVVDEEEIFPQTRAQGRVLRLGGTEPLLRDEPAEQHAVCQDSDAVQPAQVRESPFRKAAVQN